jgi:hypothetical protein
LRAKYQLTAPPLLTLAVWGTVAAFVPDSFVVFSSDWNAACIVVRLNVVSEGLSAEATFTGLVLQHLPEAFQSLESTTKQPGSNAATVTKTVKVKREELLRTSLSLFYTVFKLILYRSVSICFPSIHNKKHFVSVSFIIDITKFQVTIEINFRALTIVVNVRYAVGH